jgi:hypothetical protein
VKEGDKMIIGLRLKGKLYVRRLSPLFLNIASCHLTNSSVLASCRTQPEVCIKYRESESELMIKIRCEIIRCYLKVQLF